jgi:hypothetical protein
MEYSGAGGKLIHEKKPEAKNLVTLSLLKLLSCEMNPAEIRFIRKVFTKEKSTRPLSYESPLKLQRHLVQLLAIWKQIANTGM